MKPGTLYVVATPIGNLEDISARALRILREVPLIAAEDTRHSGRLLRHFGISTRLIAYHEHNEPVRAEELLGHLRAGRDLALVSDAGTPGIADPGYRLVHLCREQGLPVAAIPGPCALTTALSIAGLPTDRFLFEGFLSARSAARRETLAALAGERRTLVFYESPHRLTKTLRDMADTFGPEREIAVARELTKLYEELVRGPAAELVTRFETAPVRGEVVILVAPAPERVTGEETVQEALRRWRRTTDLSWKEIVRRVAAELELSGSDVYREHLAVKAELGE